MSNISLSSHDLLGKLTILKNSLFMLNRKCENEKWESSDKEYLKNAAETVEKLIQEVKEFSLEEKISSS